MSELRIAVTPEGREDIWIADRESLKAWIVAQEFEAIHNMATSVPGMTIGADHSVASVLDDIDGADRVALMTGPMRRHNLNHALALIMPADGRRPERLEMYDIDEVTEEHLSPVPAEEVPA